jgi:hypothetical protein
MTDVALAGKVRFTAEMFDPKGRVKKTFSADAEVKPAAMQLVQLAWSWEDPRLWDLGKPELYTLRLTAEGAGLADCYPQRFGFREFWIEGRNLFLNGTPVRLHTAEQGKHADGWKAWDRAALRTWMESAMALADQAAETIARMARRMSDSDRRAVRDIVDRAEARFGYVPLPAWRLSGP